MVARLIEWAVDNPLVVVLLAATLLVAGGYAFVVVNVEAYPDPAPAIVEVVAQFPNASAEQVEKLVTIPLERELANMPGLKYMRSKSLFGLAHLRNQFDYGIDYERAKQDVINRLQQAPLPPGVTPQISPASPTGEILRYTLRSPQDTRPRAEDAAVVAGPYCGTFPGNVPWAALALAARPRDIYTLNDLKSLQDWVLQRELVRLPRIAGVTSAGGSVKRYEVQPDPERLKRYGITLGQLQNAIAGSNADVSGDFLVQGHTVQVVRGLGLIGGGQDPMQPALALKSPYLAAARLRAEERLRIRQIRRIVITAVNNQPVRVEDVVDGGPVSREEELGRRGVVVSHQTRMGRVSLSRPVRGADGIEVWKDEDDKVQAIVLLRKGAESLPALRDVQAKIKELNETPGRLLPGVQIEPYYDRTELIGVTTETVRENLVLGLVLVTVILLMFLSNVRTALIVALNIPLALAFAFLVLFVRGKSANLLSIGAVDFGIIVDSSVIMVENIYRHLSFGDQAGLPLKQRILHACKEVERSLFFSTVIMVAALLPLFTMKGPEGQIFGPMADTYAFALAGALLLALTLSPVLCLVFFKHLKPARDNFLVRWLKAGYLWQLERCLNYRGAAVGAFALLTAATVGVLPFLGREFMPELEEGNLYVRGTFPINISLDRVAERVRTVRAVLQQYPEVQAIVPQIGRPDDGTDPTGFYNVEIFVPLKPAKDWPPPPGKDRPRSKEELVAAMNEELGCKFPEVDWDFSQIIRDNVMESLSGVKGENSVKIFGPDLDELERVAERVKNTLAGIRGVENAGVFRIKGQSNLELTINREACDFWNIKVADVQNVIQTAIGGQPFTKMIEGEKTFDITLRYPEPLRCDEQAILRIPVDVEDHTVTPGTAAALPPTPHTGPSSGVAASGTGGSIPALTGSLFGATLNNLSSAPRVPLEQLVTRVNPKGEPDRNGQFVRAGASTIYREQGQRLIAVKFGVRGRDLAGTVAEAQEKTAALLPPGYRAEWSGEFQEMEEAERRLLVVVSVALALIVVLLYLAFRSVLDALVVLSNVLAMSLGGVWALIATGTNFNISAAVGFISILGVAVMNGLLMVSAFNALRIQGLPLREALRAGMAKLVRPVTMTALAAIFGLLPAALSTRIGSQSQRPLAIVVVGGMIATLLLTNLVPVLYSFYGQRQPSADAARMAH